MLARKMPLDHKKTSSVLVTYRIFIGLVHDGSPATHICENVRVYAADIQSRLMGGTKIDRQPMLPVDFFVCMSMTLGWRAC